MNYFAQRTIRIVCDNVRIKKLKSVLKDTKRFKTNLENSEYDNAIYFH